MIGLRDKPMRRFGALLAGLAIYMQLAFASSGMWSLPTQADPLDALETHALCLAVEGGATQPPRRTDHPPAAPSHDHAAFCCLWHQVPGVQTVAALVPKPAVFAIIVAINSAAPFVPFRRHDPANARAPPNLA